METPALIASRLSSPAVLNDFGQCRKLLAKVLLLGVDDSVDLSPLMSPMINLLAHSDLVIKKTAYRFVCQAGCQQGELMLLAVNTLLKDCVSSNPMVRGLALRALCSVQHDAFMEHCSRCVMVALDDRSAFVRRTAVMACLSLARMNSEGLVESGVVDKLYGLVRDSDPVVVTNCLLVLEELLKTEGGVVISRSMAHYLLNKLPSLTPWGVCSVLQLLKNYKPKSEDEVFDLMNLLDVYLRDNSCSVVLQTLELFLHLTRDMPHLVTEIFTRAIDSVLGVISSGNVEMMSLLLEYLEGYLSRARAVLVPHYKAFFHRHKDPVYLKIQKVKILVDLITDDNVAEILDEIGMLCSSSADSVSFTAIKALPRIVQQCPAMSSACVNKMKELLDSDRKHIVSNTLQVLSVLNPSSLPDMEEIVARLGAVQDRVTDEKGKCAILFLIGRYGGTLNETTYILEDFVDSFETESSVQVKSQLLMSTLQLFSYRPAECQGLLGTVLELCVQDGNLELKDQATFYYSLLQSDVKLAQTLLRQV